MDPAKALNGAEYTAVALFFVAAHFGINSMGLDSGITWAVYAGALAGLLIGKVTEYYTASRPVFKVAMASKQAQQQILFLEWRWS